MPITAEQERELLNKYHLGSIYPSEWPHSQEDDDDDQSDSDDTIAPSQKSIKSRHQSKPSLSSRGSVSKYRNIDRHASLRSGLSGTQKTASGEDSLVQKDEKDPLGQHQSVVAELRRRGLPVEDNVKLRNRFMLSSTSFSPHLFLSNVHRDATTDDLLRGLDYLSRSIDEKSASLKVLVESNFERFVKAKATIDNVYTEMRTQGGSHASDEQVPARRPQSRHLSRNASHFRNTSNSFNPNSKVVGSNKKKNALTKESEYGVQGIKAPLIDVAIKAEEVWGPALGGREKEEGLRAIMTTLEQHRDAFRLGASVQEAIRKNDYDTVVSDWKRARKYADEARELADRSREDGTQLGEQDVNRIIVTARMWHDVSAQVESLKLDLWKKLKSTHGRRPVAVTEETGKEIHMELIGALLQIGVDENPIWQWLHSRQLYLRDRIARSFERARIEIEILRRRLSNKPQEDATVLGSYLRASMGSESTTRFHKDLVRECDSAGVLQFWEKVLSAINALLSTSDGILGEVIEFWDTTKSFIDNKAQKAFPNAVFAAGLEHLSLEPEDVQKLQSGAVELVNLIRETIFSFFSDAPVEDLSDLYSPIPPTPITPDTPSTTLTPSIRRSFTFDPNNVPPPSLQRGEPWEKFAFWPPSGNSLSGSQYLSRILTLIGNAAAEMASMSIVKVHRAGPESLKTLVGAVRERCVQAVVAAWIPDAERCKYMETWARNPDRRDLTTMPASFISFEERVLAGMQKIAYISEAASLAGRGGEEVVVPPSAKLLQAIRSAFVTSLYKALSGMVENAEKMKIEDGKANDPDGITVPFRGLSVEGTADSARVDFRNRNVRMLMTLSNLAHLRAETIPQLISQFESSFSVKLTEESKTIRDVLAQIDSRLFQSYVKPTIEHVRSLITAGITDQAWAPTTNRPDNAKAYIYDVLLALVYVHAEVSTTAAPLTGQILAYLLEQAGLALVTVFRARPRYTLPALMQATLDVEFFAQTLNNYTTDRASEIQSQIYIALDERTQDDARARLEGELPEMRGVLKRLREGTRGQFGCFRRERRGRDVRDGGKSGSGGGTTTSRS